MKREAHVRRVWPSMAVLIVALGALGLWAWSFGGAARSGGTAGQPGGASPDAGAPRFIRAMTANVRFANPQDGVNAWPNRREFLVKTLLKYGPDLIGCQEVTPAQGAYLIKELGKWYSYYPRAGVGRSEERGQGVGAELLGAVNESFASLDTLFYRTDCFDIVDGEAGLVLPDQLQRNPSENTFYTLAVLKEKQEAGSKKREGGGVWIVVDTHLRHGEAFATKCATAIRGKIDAMLGRYPGARVVVMGDMNHDRNSAVYRALTGAGGAAGAGGGEGVGGSGPTGGAAAMAGDKLGVLVDSFDYAKKRPNESWGNWHAFTGKSQEQWPTDLIFAGGGLTARDTEIVRDHDENGHYPSDHFFVITTLE